MNAQLTPDPYLTLVFTGRNDDFGGDFNNRFFRALRFNHERLRDAGIAHEFVFVEWRPIDRRPYLATVLGRAFDDLAPSQLRCVVVDPAYHDALSLNPRIQFQEFIAKNVGVRRARGRFVLTTNTDIYLGRGVVDYLAPQSLSPRVLYRAPRHDLKDYSDTTFMDWDVLHDERNWEAVNRITPPFFTNASGDFLLLDRSSYHEVRGFNEVYRNAKIHIDGNFCLKAYASGISLVDIDTPVFHVGRGTLHAQKGTYRNRPGEAPWGDIRWNSEVLYLNGPEWGLGDAPERALDARVTYLDFDWRAVGPMVQLQRVVSPAVLAAAAGSVAPS
jgi:hypothetical protein